jgi:hypothetical protein
MGLSDTQNCIKFGADELAAISLAACGAKCNDNLRA